MMFFGFGFLLILGILVWLAVSRPNAVGQAIGAARPTSPQGAAHLAGADSAESIARERFARGEIDQAEYERLIRGLRG
jgi:uncharacterized membrane protein